MLATVNANPTREKNLPTFTLYWTFSTWIGFCGEPVCDRGLDWLAPSWFGKFVSIIFFETVDYYSTLGISTVYHIYSIVVVNFMIKNFSFLLSKCAGEDLNLHTLAGTRPSTLRVYQFRHPRLFGFLYFVVSFLLFVLFIHHYFANHPYLLHFLTCFFCRAIADII